MSSVRNNWEEAFKLMVKNGDDSLLIPDFFEDETDFIKESKFNNDDDKNKDS